MHASPARILLLLLLLLLLLSIPRTQDRDGQEVPPQHGGNDAREQNHVVQQGRQV
jgi:hypothetical protein